VTVAAGPDAPRVAAGPLPFEELFAPFVLRARREVERRLAAPPGRVSPLDRFAAAARLALECSLLRWLAHAAAPSLHAELERGRPAGRALLGVFLRAQASATEAPRERYRALVDELGSDELRSFLLARPVLARLVDGLIADWCDTTVELTQRLDGDLATIRERFGWLGDPGAVVALEADLSDPHHGGRSVVALTFASDARLVYKPRSLACDAAFGAFLTWCEPELRVPLLLDRGTHGWAEYIEHAPCADDAAVERFYARAGMLLCALYLLGTTDCHFENVVAHGEYPVLIDAETILQPQMPQPSSAAAWAPDPDERAWDTVVRTGLLPQWDFSADGRLALDTSALGSFAALQAAQPKPAWRNVNTDDMTRGTEPWTPAAPRSVPVLHDEPVSPRDHLDAFVAGFRRMHAAIAARRDALLAAAAALKSPPDAPASTPAGEESPPAVLANVRVRFIPRATQDYMLALNEALEPSALASDAARARAFDVLSRAFGNAPEPGVQAGLRAIEPAERRALERLDVPYFTIAATGAEIDSGDGPPVPIPVLASGFEDLVTRLRRWDETDLRRQLAIIRGMFHARTARAFDVTSGAKPFPRASDSDSAGGRAASFVAAARDIGDELEAASVPARDGSVSWLGLAHHAGADRFALEPLGFDLYGGSAGIALFLATLADVADEPRFRDLALASVAGLRTRLRTPPAARDLAVRIGIGGATGIGSIVYALTRLAPLLDGPSSFADGSASFGDGGSSLLDGARLLGDARLAAALIDDEAIGRDTIFDVIAGSAGAILGLLALHRAAPDATVLARAVAAGEHLLRARSGEIGRRAWITFAERPLTGLAHGAAGIALALVRLHAATGDARFLAAAREALAYERAAYAPDAGNWPDFRALMTRDGEPGFSVMWCHGAPGIGLARLAALREFDDPESAAEVHAAVAATIAFGVRGPDYLCCGNLGRAELLLQAGLDFDRPALRRRAEALAEDVLRDARRDGGFRLVYDMRASGYKPDLFRGAAGVGYALLRLAAPQRVPSVLSWD
jgi:type 2 lantibiotic biosynthesis protein LanM